MCVNPLLTDNCQHSLQRWLGADISWNLYFRDQTHSQTSQIHINAYTHTPVHIHITKTESVTEKKIEREKLREVVSPSMLLLVFSVGTGSQ